MSSLAFAERPAAGDPAGLLILHHGRGTDERDLIGLADTLDPERRLHTFAPRGPLTIPGWPGHHWYVVPRVGYPDPETFAAAHRQLAAFHDAVWERTGIGPGATVLGGFSMGAVMSYALGLDPGRPSPAGVLAFSGFIPTVEGWRADPGSRAGLPVFIAHGRNDPVIDVAFARQARERLDASGAAVTYLESDASHAIPPAHADGGRRWLAQLPTAAAGRPSAAPHAPTRPTPRAA